MTLSSCWSDFLAHCPRPPYVHPEDWSHLENGGYWRGKPQLQEPLDFERFLQSTRFGDAQETDFHLSLLPIPYLGNLNSEETSVFILQLNPGFHHGDFYGEYKRPEFREALARNLKQDFGKTEYPFLYLDPRFCWTSGYVYWEEKLRQLVAEVARTKRAGYLDALRTVSKRIAVVELVPYHSAKFKSSKLVMSLPTAQAAKEWARNHLTRRAVAGEVVIVVIRGTREWDIEEVPGKIVCYTKKGEALSAHLTPDSRGWKPILGQLLRDR